MMIAKVIARAWSERDYRSRLLSSPRAVLAEAAQEQSAGKITTAIESTVDRVPVSMAAPWTGTGDPYKIAKTFHALAGSGGLAASDGQSLTKKRH